MKTNILRHLVLLTTLGCAFSSLTAQTVPLTISYQGSVTDSGGVGLGTGTPINRKVLFRIYDAATAGTRLWTEEQTVVLADGQFSVQLGTGGAGTGSAAGESRPALDTVFTSAGVSRFIGVTVDNGDNNFNASDVEITPRQQIASTPYAFRARVADTIASGTDLMLNNSANYGLGYYGTGRLFNGVALDGPVLYGASGGALGTVNGTTQLAALRWNSAGNVGIGTAGLTTGTTKLVVQGDDAGTGEGAQQIMIRGSTASTKKLILGIDTTGNRGMIQAVNSGSVYLPLILNQEGGNVIIASGAGGGSVGIGTAAPTTKLHVNGTVTATSFSGSGAALTGVSASSVQAANITGTIASGQLASGLTLAGTTSGTFSGSGAALTTLNASNVSSGTLADARLSGNVALLGGAQTFTGAKSFSLAVGIGGGTAPAGTTTNRLYLTGNSTATAPDQLIIRGSTDNDLRLDMGIKTDTAGDGRYGSIQAHDAGTAYLPLTLNPGGGRVGIGLANPSSFGVLDINVAGNGNGWDVRFVNGSVVGGLRMSSGNFLEMTNAIGADGNIAGDGYARLNSNGDWSAVSDRRLKKEIKPLSGLLEKALSLQPVSYRFKSQNTPDQHIGFIAQEVREVLPSFVTEGETLTLNYAGLSTVAIGAIKEQHQIVKEQQQKIESLEERVKALEARDKARDAKLAAFEKLLDSLEKPAAQTVSLKAGQGAE